MDKSVIGKKIVIMAIVFFVGLSFVLFGLPFKDIIDYYHYDSIKDLNYSVNLIPNNFYENIILGEGLTYPANLTNGININANYNFQGDRESAITYKYNMIGYLEGYIVNGDNTRSKIWERQYTLLETKTKTLTNQKSFKINENILVDFNAYKNYVLAYRNANDINIEADFKIKFNVVADTDIKYSNDELALTKKENKVSANETMELIIPLTNKAYSIKKNYKTDDSKDYVVNNSKDMNVAMVVIGIILMAGSIILLIRGFKKNNTSISERNERRVFQILKDYADLIVTVNKRPDIKNLRTMYVDRFEDMIDLSEQNKCNIIHYVTEKRKKSTFMIILNKYVYIYRVNEKDL